MKWVTRERPKIDRIACPWLIARFIDPEPEFLYVPPVEVSKVAEETGAIPYDIPGVELGHHDGLCSFDAFIAKYAIRDAAVARLALIVRAADCGQPELAKEAAGLLAISKGLSLNFVDDHEMLRHGMVVYDALYAWCADAPLKEVAPLPGSSMIQRMLLPAGADTAVMPLLFGRALRAFADGYVAILLPAYLLALGFETWQVGSLATATLLGSALTTLAVGTWGHHFRPRRLLLGAALLMAFTGFSFAAQSAFWPLLLIAFFGTLNPSSGDVSLFLPLEHARLAEAAQGSARTALFARYSVLGALLAAVGALAAGLPDRIILLAEVTRLDALRLMFVFYGLVGCMVWLLYRRLPKPHTEKQQPPSPLGSSRRTVLKLAALFSVDAFAGGLVVNSLLALWLFQRFELSLTAAGAFFFWAGLLTASSQLAAPGLAKRIGLLNTMVFTHIPANLCLIGAAFAPKLEMAMGLLLFRALLSQMDVPTRSAFVMTVVTPEERAAAASFTAVPRSLASAISPMLSGALLTNGWSATPLVVCGILKIAYDLTLWRAFQRFKEQR